MWELGFESERIARGKCDGDWIGENLSFETRNGFRKWEFVDFMIDLLNATSMAETGIQRIDEMGIFM